MSRPSVLVLHGITMSGDSTLALMGRLRDALEAAGFELVAPNGGRRFRADALAGLLPSLSTLYAAQGQDATEWFREGVFWQGDVHHGWFGAETDRETGVKTYTTLEASLEAIRRATEGREIVGVLGFSQGCAMAALVAGLAKKGKLGFGDTLRFGVFLSGFKPTFDLPELDPWPVTGLASLVLTGSEDAVFPDRSALDLLASALEAPEVHYVDGLVHTIPTSPEWVAHITHFATRAL